MRPILQNALFDKNTVIVARGFPPHVEPAFLAGIAQGRNLGVATLRIDLIEDKFDFEDALNSVADCAVVAFTGFENCLDLLAPGSVLSPYAMTVPGVLKADDLISALDRPYPTHRSRSFILLTHAKTMLNPRIINDDRMGSIIDYSAAMRFI